MFQKQHKRWINKCDQLSTSFSTGGFSCFSGHSRHLTWEERSPSAAISLLEWFCCISNKYMFVDGSLGALDAYWDGVLAGSRDIEFAFWWKFNHKHSVFLEGLTVTCANQALSFSSISLHTCWVESLSNTCRASSITDESTNLFLQFYFCCYC